MPLNKEPRPEPKKNCFSFWRDRLKKFEKWCAKWGIVYAENGVLLGVYPLLLSLFHCHKKINDLKRV